MTDGRMDVFPLLEFLDEELSSASGVPLTGKRLVDTEKCKDIIRELRIKLPGEIEEAENILIERDQILDEAAAEADNIVKDAEERFRHRLEEHEITRAARQQAQDIIDDARKQAEDIRDSALDYVDRIMAELERTLTRMSDEVRRNRDMLDE